MLDYKMVQNINLDRIPYGPYYQPSAATLTIVRMCLLEIIEYLNFEHTKTLCNKCAFIEDRPFDKH